jgi:hypothetical protein
MPFLVPHNNYQLVDINVGLAAGLSVINPLALSLEASLFGAFGLGPLQLDFQARLDAALSVSLNWNPSAQIKALGELAGAISAGLVLPLPAVNASADAAADLQLKIGGIQILLDAGLALILPSLDAVAAGQAALNASIGYLVWNGSGAQLAPELYATISANYGAAGQVAVLCIFMDAAAFAAISGNIFVGIPGVPDAAMFKTTP